MNVQANFKGVSVFKEKYGHFIASKWPSSRVTQRAWLLGTAWRRDGVDVLRYSQAKTQRYATQYRSGDARMPPLLGPISKTQ
jgi:hypothetical protein